MPEFSEGLISVVKDGKIGFINSRGKLVIPCAYHLVGRFHDGLVWVLQDRTFKIIDKTGKTIMSDLDGPHLVDWSNIDEPIKISDSIISQ